jgi:hypothetical protein
MSESGNRDGRSGVTIQDEVARVVRTGRTIVLAMVAGIALFTVVASVLVAGEMAGEGLSGRASGPLLIAVGVAIFVMFLTAPVVRRAVQEQGSPPPDRLPQRWLTALLVASAVREGAGLMGIVLGLLAGSVPFVLGAGVATVAAFLLAFPRGEELEAAVRRGGGGVVSRPPPSGPTPSRPR